MDKSSRIQSLVHRIRRVLPLGLGGIGPGREALERAIEEYRRARRRGDAQASR